MQSRRHSISWEGIWSGSSVSRTAGRSFVLLLWLLSILAAPLALAETRFALVIGNGDYAALPTLPNPTNDAEDMADALEALGFEVALGLDLSRTDMLGMIDRIAGAAQSYDIVLFYYAGHGFQIDNQNYLAPVDANLQQHQDIVDQTVNLSQMTEALEGTPSIKLIFLDACRDNPVGPLVDDQGAARDGLARVGDAEGFLFAFSTQPDNVAQDGLGRNSPFTEAILGHIHTTGQDLGSMMISVRKDVLASTGGQQIPWENTSLTRQFYFKPGVELVPPETMLWQLAATSEDRALLRIYLDRYPQGAHVGEAADLLQEVQVAGLETGTDQAVRNVSSDADRAAVLEDQLWDLARRLRARPLVEIYLDQYAAGRHAAEAQRLQALLHRTEEAEASPGPLCRRLATHPRDATANTTGVPLDVLAEHAELAIETCTKAAELQPELPHYTALLARAMSAAGRTAEAVALYREAAERGDLRAMVSLGLISESGDGAPRDLELAYSLYERAAERGSPDGAINLAVALVRGVGIERDAARAEALLRAAADRGSAIATYNLGVLAQDGLVTEEGAALAFFERAADLGEPRAYVAAAILLDEGRGVEKDPKAAAEMLLRGAASDYGEAITQLTAQAKNWSRDTIKAVQEMLRSDGLYGGAVDGISGPMLREALVLWRSGGIIHMADRE